MHRIVNECKENRGQAPPPHMQVCFYLRWPYSHLCKIHGEMGETYLHYPVPVPCVQWISCSYERAWRMPTASQPWSLIIRAFHNVITNRWVPECKILEHGHYSFGKNSCQYSCSACLLRNLLWTKTDITGTKQQSAALFVHFVFLVAYWKISHYHLPSLHLCKHNLVYYP